MLIDTFWKYNTVAVDHSTDFSGIIRETLRIKQCRDLMQTLITRTLYHSCYLNDFILCLWIIYNAIVGLVVPC